MDKLNEMNSSDARIKRLRICRNFIIFFLIIFLIAVIASTYALVQRLNSNKGDELPSGRLSQSIFEQQNNDAITPEGQYIEYYLYDNHYSYDVSDSKQALKGNTYFYSFNNDEDYADCTMGISEIRDINLDASVSAVNSDLNAGFSIGSLKILDKQHGYRNGWETDCLFMTDGKNNVVSYFAKVEEGMFAVTAFGEIDFEDLIKDCLDVFDTFKVSDEWIAEHESTTEYIESESDIEHLE